MIVLWWFTLCFVVSCVTCVQQHCVIKKRAHLKKCVALPLNHNSINIFFLFYVKAEDPAQKSFFSEIISSISDIKFGGDGRYIIARDYLTLKIWDLHNNAKPLRTIRIHDYLRTKLCDLYENDCIFDK